MIRSCVFLVLGGLAMAMATFGADASLVGGATAALADVIADPTLVPVRYETG